MNTENLELINAESITPEEIHWLWPHWLAYRKLHILAGPAGTGKTSLLLSIAAIISKQKSWPCGHPSDLKKTVIWSSEDSPEDTLVPRLIANKADLSMIEFVGDIKGKIHRTFDPARDMELLASTINSMNNVGLVILDPIVSLIATDSHKNSDVRRGLQPVVELAEKNSCAIVGITHLSKGTNGRDPVERINGSVAFGALARVVLIAVKAPSNFNNKEDSRLLVRAKSNIGPDSGGFLYSIKERALKDYPKISNTYIDWREYVEGEPSDLLSLNKAVNEPEKEIDSAKEFLKHLLTDSPLYSTQVYELCEDHGYSKATVRRAKKSLGIISHRAEGIAENGKWMWKLPPSLRTLS